MIKAIKKKMYKKKIDLPVDFNIDDFSKYIESLSIDNGHAINVYISRRYYHYMTIRTKKEQPIWSLTSYNIEEMKNGEIVLVSYTKKQGKINYEREIVDWPIGDYVKYYKRSK